MHKDPPCEDLNYAVFVSWLFKDSIQPYHAHQKSLWYIVIIYRDKSPFSERSKIKL